MARVLLASEQEQDACIGVLFVISMSYNVTARQKVAIVRLCIALKIVEPGVVCNQRHRQQVNQQHR
jgi:hypothetical protein